jgi:cold shock CspA family protein
MPQGVIKHYRADRGYGFITQDSGDADMFVHLRSAPFLRSECA